MHKNFWVLIVVSSFAFSPLVAGLFMDRYAVQAQGDATPNPAIETAVALTLTAFDQSLSTPTLSEEEQIEATVMATLRRTVWIEDTSGEVHEFMQSVPSEIRARDREGADQRVVIEVIETEASPLSVSGCGSVERYKVDYAVSLVDREADQVVDTVLLEGHVPNPFILTSCNPLRGRPTFEEFFHWLAPRVYLVATPTPTFTYTPDATYTPIPTSTVTAPASTGIVPAAGNWSSPELPAGDTEIISMSFTVSEDGKQVSSFVASGENLEGCGMTGIEGGMREELSTSIDIVDGTFAFSIDFGLGKEIGLEGTFISPTQAEGTYKWICGEEIVWEWVSEAVVDTGEVEASISAPRAGNWSPVEGATDNSETVLVEFTVQEGGEQVTSVVVSGETIGGCGISSIGTIEISGSGDIRQGSFILTSSAGFLDLDMELHGTFLSPTEAEGTFKFICDNNEEIVWEWASALSEA